MGTALGPKMSFQETISALLGAQIDIHRLEGFAGDVAGDADGADSGAARGFADL